MGSKIKKYKRRRGRRRRKGGGGGLYYRREKGRAGAERFTMTCHPRQPSVTRRMVVSSVIIALAHTRGAHSTARHGKTHTTHIPKSPALLYLTEWLVFRRFPDFVLLLLRLLLFLLPSSKQHSYVVLLLSQGFLCVPFTRSSSFGYFQKLKRPTLWEPSVPFSSFLRPINKSKLNLKTE